MDAFGKKWYKLNPFTEIAKEVQFVPLRTRMKFTGFLGRERQMSTSTV
jgi:hypothetical protein